MKNNTHTKPSPEVDGAILGVLFPQAIKEAKQLATTGTGIIPLLGKI